MYHQL